MILRKAVTERNARLEVDRLSRFLYKNAKLIAKILIGSSAYRTMNIGIIKHSSVAGRAELELELRVYEDGKTHFYLKSCTREDLMKSLEELENAE